MKTRNLISIIFILITLAAGVFATPAVRIKAFDREVKWDGLNLKTLTNDKHEGELQFKNGLDVRGGAEYIFTLNLTNTEKQDQEKYTKKITDKFAHRLELYGYRDFQINWSISQENTAEIDLKIAKKNKSDSIVIQLLASRGELQFWTQDPNYNSDTDTTENFSFLTGMTPAEITQDDIASVTSLFTNKANGYGFKIEFKNSALTKLLLMSQTETSRGTMLVVDGQPISFRTYQIENLTGGSKDAKPVMYMSSLFSDSFSVNDTVPVIFETGQLEQEMSLTEQNEIGPSLSENAEWDIKFISTVSLLVISLILIYRYRYVGVFQVLLTGEFLVWTLFLLKFGGAYLNLSLMFGVVCALVLNLFIHLSTTKQLKSAFASNEKQYFNKVKEIRPRYRNLILIVMGLSIIMSYVPFVEVSGFGNGVGVGMIVSLALIYILGPSLLQFLAWQKDYEKNNKV